WDLEHGSPTRMQVEGNEMFERTVLLLLLATLMASCAGTSREIAPPVTTRQQANVVGISSDKAIDIANDAALKTYPSLKGFKHVICEQQIFWRIIYDG